MVGRLGCQQHVADGVSLHALSKEPYCQRVTLWLTFSMPHGDRITTGLADRNYMGNQPSS